LSFTWSFEGRTGNQKPKTDKKKALNWKAEYLVYDNLFFSYIYVKTILYSIIKFHKWFLWIALLFRPFTVVISAVNVQLFRNSKPFL